MSGDLGPAAIKGGVLIVVALVLGTFLLWRGTDSELGLASAPDGAVPGVPADDSDPDDAPPPENDAEGDPGEGTTGDDGEPDAPDEGDDEGDAAAVRPPGEVTVQVANGSGIPGAAGRIGEQLVAEGYLITDPDNAKVAGEASTVYYIADFGSEAEALAVALGLDPAAEGVVEEMPSPLPTVDENLGAANLLLVAGTDIAPTS